MRSSYISPLLAVYRSEEPESVTYLIITALDDFDSFPVASQAHSRQNQMLPLEVVNCLENARFVSRTTTASLWSAHENKTD